MRPATARRHAKAPALAVLAAAALVPLAAACGSSSPKPVELSPVTSGLARPATVSAITTMHLAQVDATVLVEGSGLPLYMFLPDADHQVTCTGLCAATWPPVYARGQKIATSGAARASLLGADADPTGGKVVTYDGWPLYTYEDDTQPGEAAGQGVNLDGGYWYLMEPDGTPLVPAGMPGPTTTAGAGAATTTTTTAATTTTTASQGG